MSSNAIRLQQTGEELISDEVNEIISYRPHWIIRQGNVIFFIILLLLLSLTWFIRYPDIVNASARLVAANAPKEVATKAQGKLARLFVTNEQQVKKGQHLGCMETTADYNEVMRLQQWIDETIQSTQAQDYTALIKNPLPFLFSLGELQTVYQSFQNQFAQTKEILASGYYQAKNAALQKDLQYLAQLKNNAYRQQELTKQDQELQKKEYQAYEQLAKEKVIAPLELNQYKTKLLAKDQSLEQIKAQITNSDVASHSKLKEMMDLRKQITDQQQAFHSALLDLKSEIQKWLQQHVLVASEDGQVLFATTLEENQLVSAGQTLFFIQGGQSLYYAELMAAQRGFGKIKQGQKVMIKVDSYPSEEFGYIKGTVSYLSAIPNRKDSFLVKLDLPDGLRTNQQKDILFRNNLSAQAEVITDERKLFDRMLGQLKQIINR